MKKKEKENVWSIGAYPKWHGEKPKSEALS
jgi:hypothetical protein